MLIQRSKQIRVLMFGGVKREYTDVFVLALNTFGIQWDDCKYFDPEDYENYVQSEYEEEEE